MLTVFNTGVKKTLLPSWGRHSSDRDQIIHKYINVIMSQVVKKNNTMEVDREPWAGSQGIPRVVGETLS